MTEAKIHYWSGLPDVKPSRKSKCGCDQASRACQVIRYPRANILVLLVLILMSIAINVEAQEHIAGDCKRYNDALEGDDGLSPTVRDQLRAASYLSQTFIWENDSFANGGDYHYTNGMKWSWEHNPCRHKYKGAKEAYKSALSWFGVPINSSGISTGGLVGMIMYTPNNLRAHEPILTDRPYGGWAYGGWSFHARTFVENSEADAHPREKNSYQLELQLGVTGPKSAQREAQEFIHRNITHSTMPQGWDNQIGGRLGVNLLYGYRTNYFHNFPWTSIRVVPHTGFNLGNLVQFINAGGMILIGRSGADYPGTTLQPTGNSRLIPSKVPLGQSEMTPQSEDGSVSSRQRKQRVRVRPESVNYFFVGVDVRRVFGNIFVTGFGATSRDISLNPWVYDIIKFGYAYGTESFRFAYKIFDRSREFQSPDPAMERVHRIGQIEVTCYF